MFKSLLITGGAGFIGSSIGINLKADFPELKITATDNLNRRGSEFNIGRLIEKGITFIHGDVRNQEDLEKIGPFDLLIECSAEPSVRGGVTSSSRYVINTNIGGMVNCLELAKEYKSDVIFLSTSRVYSTDILNSLKLKENDTRFVPENIENILGISEHGISEEFSTRGRRTLYGTTKLASEMLLEEYIEMFGIRGIINRCGIITGPWQMGKIDQGVVSFWIAKHIYSEELAYIGYGGKGKQVRDILHIDDFYEVIKLQVLDFAKYSGKIFNVGGGQDMSISLQELTELCQEVTGNKIKISSRPETRNTDIPYYVTDFTKLHNLTGWKPKKNKKVIINETVSWIKNNKELLKHTLVKR